MVQQEIPFRYVRFHGILSDEMGVYNEDENENVYYNFNYVDELIDFLLEIKLKPFIELGFMPDKLSKEKTYLFAWHANIGVPQKMNVWKDLVENLIEHFIERYGRKEVRTWYFEIWNDPDLVSKFYPRSKAGGFPLLKATYESIKKVDPKLIVGGINTFSNILSERMMKSYLFYLRNEAISLDFISLSLYSTKYNLQGFEGNLKRIAKNKSRDFVSPQQMIAETDFLSIEESKDLIGSFKKQIEKAGFQGELIINEWNLVPDPRELINDTCFKGTHFVKSMLELSSLVQAVAYWTFSDIFDEVLFKERMFHGGIGFITKNGLKKPVYYAYEILNKLSDEIITRGDCYIATSSETGVITILFYNYCEPRNFEFGQAEQEDIYRFFSEAEKKLKVELAGCSGHYIRNTYRINREEGSVYDTWINMGAPMTIKQEQKKFLNNKSLYHFDTEEVFLTDQTSISLCLLPHEVALIELLPM